MSEKIMSDPGRQPVGASMVRGRDINRCGGCGIQDKRVEAGGIYHCPNPLCRMSGAAHVRNQMGFHVSADSSGYTPTDEWLNLRAWALRMVNAKDEKPLTTEKLEKPPAREGDDG